MSRSPLGLRGLKYRQKVRVLPGQWSQPTRAAWIEIITDCRWYTQAGSQPTRAAWIEISNVYALNNVLTCRSPLGLRGLKFPTGNNSYNLCNGRSPLGLRGLK